MGVRDSPRGSRTGSRALGRAAALAALLAMSAPGSAQPASPAFPDEAGRADDFRAFCAFVSDTYAYADTWATDWEQACRYFAPRAAAAADRAQFVGVLEQALGQIYDAHAHLGTNTDHSPRLVPSGASVVAHWRQGDAVVSAVRPGSDALRAGVRAGMTVLAVNGTPIGAAAAARLPRFLRHDDPAAHDWALQVALAAEHDHAAIDLQVRDATGTRTIHYLAPDHANEGLDLLSSRRAGPVGLIHINNSLGQSGLVAAFDSALDALADTRALVLDLRDTPGGGTSSVARGLLGRFAPGIVPYQRHERPQEMRETGVRRIWVEYVAPRGKRYSGPVIVLVGPWTGSMGEGLAIGFNAVTGAVVVGQPMAHLRGALDQTELPHTGIVVRVPAEKIFHVDGRPREDFVPAPLPVSGAGAASEDPELGAALALAARQGPRAYTGPAGSGAPAEVVK